MYSDLPSVKTMVEKVLTLEEFTDSELTVSVLSYSSKGDLTVHAERVKVEEFMAPASKYVEEIRKMRVTGLTCISQALRGALNLVQDGELTCVTLHADGYANDLSPGAEKREIDAIVAEMAKRPGLFVNTVAYRDWCDFKLLTSIANACSGSCFHTPSSKELFTTLQQTSALLAGQVTPALALPLENAAYTTFVSKKGEKVLGASGDTLVRGLPADADSTGYRYFQMTKEEYDASSAPSAGDDAILAYAYGQLADGNLNAAKYALVASRNKALLEGHAKALTNPQITALVGDLKKAILTPDASAEKTEGYGVPNATAPSVMGLLGLLSNYPDGVLVDLPELRKGYKRTGVRRIPGTRQPDGTVTEPTVREKKLDLQWVPVNSVDLNRNTANCNITLRLPLTLERVSDGSLIEDAGGVSLKNLQTFRAYTVVSEGSLNLPSLTLKVSNKRLFRELQALGLTTEEFNGSNVVTLDFLSRPLVPYTASFEESVVFPTGIFDRMLLQKMLISFIGARIPSEASDTFSDEQVQALKEVYLTGSLYFSPPTTTHYADLQDALSKGEVDYKTSYKVDFGSRTILNLGELHSANKFLERMYELAPAGGTTEKKPKCEMLNNPSMNVARKVLSARTKLTPVDDQMKPVYDELLLFQEPNILLQEITPEQAELLRTRAFNDTLLEGLKDLKRELEARLESNYEKISALVFYVGATGTVPLGGDDGLKAMTADSLKELVPTLEYAIGKNEADGSFFLLPETGVVLSVYPKSELFTTGE
jgi:hypothetical protein